MSAEHLYRDLCEMRVPGTQPEFLTDTLLSLSQKSDTSIGHELRGRSGPTSALCPPITDGKGMGVDALALGIAVARGKLLDGQHLLVRKPDLVVRKRASGHGPVEHGI